METQERRQVRVTYDAFGDILEVLWEDAEGSYVGTNDDRVLARLDSSGRIIGMMVQHASTAMDQNAIDAVLVGGPQPEPAVPVRVAAERLGVSERRVRQLLAEGRFEGARLVGRDWIIPQPIAITPARYGRVGVARRIAESKAPYITGNNKTTE